MKITISEGGPNIKEEINGRDVFLIPGQTYEVKDERGKKLMDIYSNISEASSVKDTKKKKDKEE